MSLSKQDRIELSLKLSGAKEDIANMDKLAEVFEQAKVKAQQKDSPNKKLLDERTALVNAYQNELVFLDGIVRTQLVEYMIVDSAKRVAGNHFFPNQNNVSLPSVPTGIWTGFSPLSRNYAIGKTHLETYTSTGNRTEQNIIADINAKITLIESKIIASRATGKKGQTTGTCSGETPAGSGTTQILCTTKGGTWTPGPDIFVNDTDTQQLLTDLKTLVQEWKNILNSQKSILISISDLNSSRKTQNLNAITNIDDSISVINNWQSIQDYDTTTPLPSTIAAFNALLESYFQQTKMQPTTLQLLKDRLTQRLVFANARKDQLTTTYLGSITQDMSEGEIYSTTGLYGERMLFLDMRINASGGTLTEVVSFSNSKGAQEKTKKSINIATQGAGLVMKATKASAPGIDTFYMNFEDLSGFAVGDSVYLVADDQEELLGKIQEIIGNRAKLSFSVPKKYTTINNTRIYKIL